MELGNATMAEEKGEELKRGVSLMMPVTPAKPIPLSHELNYSIFNHGMSNLDKNLHASFDDDNPMLFSVHASNGLYELASEKGLECLGNIDLNQSVSDSEFGVSNGVCLDQCSVSSSGKACNAVGRLDSGNLSTNAVNSAEVMASHDDASFRAVGASGRATQEGFQGIVPYQDNSKVQAPHEGVDRGCFDGNSLHYSGSCSGAASTPAKESNPRKRGNNGIDINRKRPKMKRHRPKILDESKPRKTPKSRSPKNSASTSSVPRMVPLGKEKYMKRSSAKASVNSIESNEGQAGRPTAELISEDGGKLGKSSVVEAVEPSVLNPWTPEPSTPQHAISMDSPCERRHGVAKDTRELENNDGQEINYNSELRAKSCRRSLNFMEEPMQNKILYQYQSQNMGQVKLSFKWESSLDLREQDFDFCNELIRIVNEYQSGKKGLTKSEIKRSAGSNSRTRYCNSRTGRKKKSNVGSSPIPDQVKETTAFLTNGGELNSQQPGAINQTGCQYNSLKVYQRSFRPNQCPQNSRKMGPNFPKAFKKKMSKRRRIEDCGRLLKVLTADESRMQGKGHRSDKMTENTAAKRTVIRKAGRRLAPQSSQKHSLDVKISKSRCVQEEKDCTVIKKGLSNTTVPFSFVVPKKKRSKLFIQHKKRLPSSHCANYFEPEVCGYFRDINNQNFLRKESSFLDHLVMDCNKIEEDPPEWHGRLLESQENQDVTLNNVQNPLQQVIVSTNNNIPPRCLECYDALTISNSRDTTPNTSQDPFKQENVTSNSEACCSECYGASQFSSSHDIMLNTLQHPAGKEHVPSNNALEACYLTCNGNLHIRNSEDEMLKILYGNVSQEIVRPNNIQACSPKANDVMRTSSPDDEYTKALIIHEQEPLANKCPQIVVQDQDINGALLPYDGTKKKKPQSKVDIDSETIRIWNLLMENDGGNITEEVNEEKEKWWEEQRKIFRRRIDSLLALMHLIQGDRRFSPWKGSVVDSVVGAFLTQNVSDHLSSSAFMSLRARYPPKSRSDKVDGDEDTASNNVVVRSSTQEDTKANEIEDSHSHLVQTEENIDIPCAERTEEKQFLAVSAEDGIGHNGDQQKDFSISCDSNTGTHAFSLHETLDAFRQKLQVEESDFLKNFYGPLKGLSEFGENESIASCLEEVIAPKEHHESSINYHEKNPRPERKSRGKKGKIEEKQQENTDWDQLRKIYSSSRSRDTAREDAVDWEAVRKATIEEVAATIALRGQHNIIAMRIKELLDRLVKDHGSIDLEWLRDVPPNKAKEYLLSIKGLGLKSVECIRLLELGHMAFPVDTNVGRVAVRLGWVPLQPLPEDLQIHLLNQYPLTDAIQKYLWPRLCTLDQLTLYELHYQLITFGKVFCTKRKPNCNACPMRGECRHFASAFASARLRLPGLQQKGIVTSTAPVAAHPEPTVLETPVFQLLPDCNCPESGYRTLECEPTVEFPQSPELEPMEIPDIEDFCYDTEDEIPVIKLNTVEFKQNLLQFVDNTEPFLEQGDVSQALVALSFEAASVPAPKLRDVNRLRTVHQVYELPDTHPLLARLEKRELDDPCPYLLAISTTDESSNCSEQSREPSSTLEPDLHDLSSSSTCDVSRGQNCPMVRGTIFVPCRTAEKGSFPLNGTYFQVNEVFADHESSHRQINVPRAWLWNLPRRTLYCGTSATSIFKGMSMEEIQRCFWRGFICVRGFDRETGNYKPLSDRFHFSTTMAWKKKSGERVERMPTSKENV